PGRAGVPRLTLQLADRRRALLGGGVRRGDQALELEAARGVTLDHQPALLVLHDLRGLGHQTFSPWARSRATTASMPSLSTVLIPLVLRVSRTYRPSLGSQ